jgi:hypothetical protein
VSDEIPILECKNNEGVCIIKNTSEGDMGRERRYRIRKRRQIQLKKDKEKGTKW